MKKLIEKFHNYLLKNPNVSKYIVKSLNFLALYVSLILSIFRKLLK